jgi:hypothetical protein
MLNLCPAYIGAFSILLDMYTCAAQSHILFCLCISCVSDRDAYGCPSCSGCGLTWLDREVGIDILSIVRSDFALLVNMMIGYCHQYIWKNNSVMTTSTCQLQTLWHRSCQMSRAPCVSSLCGTHDGIVALRCTVYTIACKLVN